MKKEYDVKFTVEATVEAWNEEQIKDELSFELGKMLNSVFGIMARGSFEIKSIMEHIHEEDNSTDQKGDC
jgi:uncharacterized protein YyaL (SSP411 family)